MNTNTLKLPEQSSLWHNNSVAVQVLGLSPIFAVSDTAVNGIGLGLATFIVTVAACITASIANNYINYTWRLVYYMVIIAVFVSLIETLMRVAFFPLYRSLGIYVPLICCNAAILYRIETYSCRVSPAIALRDALNTALGFLWIIVLFSVIREWLSFGTFFANRDLLAPYLVLAGTESVGINTDNFSFKFPLLQPGALIIFGLLVALKKLLDQRLLRPSSKTSTGENSANSRASEQNQVEQA